MSRSRDQFFRIARHFTPAVAVDTPDGRYFVATRDPFIGRGTFLHGSFDEAALRDGLDAVRRYVDGFDLAGRTVLDVGANIGTQTIPFLTAHGADRVVAIEPDGHNATLLRQNVVANRLEPRVTVLELAATDHDGTVELELSPHNLGDHRVRTAAAVDVATAAERERSVVGVRAARIDSLIDEGAIDADAIGLLWLDTQGHEGHVLAGATRLLGRVPTVTEYCPGLLRYAGGLDRFHALVAEHYDRVVDLQSPYPERPARVIPATEIAALAERYFGEGDAPTTQTDLVLLPA